MSARRGREIRGRLEADGALELGELGVACAVGGGVGLGCFGCGDGGGFDGFGALFGEGCLQVGIVVIVAKVYLFNCAGGVGAVGGVCGWLILARGSKGRVEGGAFGRG